MKKSTLLKLMNFWPPFIGAGIKVKNISADATAFDVEMKLTRWNRNYVGTHFGGSLYSMCDPFFMLILIENLGKNYIVWDKAATIRFKKPGKSKVLAHFEISRATILEIKQLADTGVKVEPVFTANIVDQSGNIIAEVEKTLYIRKK